MPALNVLEQDQQRLRLVGRQTAPSQAHDQGELPGEAPGADRDMLPDHFEFNRIFAHTWITAGCPGSGRVPSTGSRH